MQEYRKVDGAYPGHVLEKRGRTRLTRVLGKTTVQETSPFMLLETIESGAPEDIQEGFPWRAYPGIESFLYFFDSTRERGRADVNLETPSWVCSANGAYVDELPAFETPVMGVQLWIWANTDVKPVPALACPGRTQLTPVIIGAATIQVIAGTFADQLGAVALPQSGSTILDVFIEPKSDFALQGFERDPVLAYVMQGDGFFGEDEDELYPQGRALTFTPGQTLAVKSTHRGLRFLLIHAPNSENAVPVLDMNAVERNDADWAEIVADQRR